MATIFNQMFAPEKGRERVPVHAMYAVLMQLADGKIDELTMKGILDGTDESNLDVKAIVQKLEAMVTADRLQWIMKFHSRCLLNDLNVKYGTIKDVGYKDDASFRAVMGY